MMYTKKIFLIFFVTITCLNAEIFDGTPKVIFTITNSHGGGKYLDEKINRYQGEHNITINRLGGWGTGVDENGEARSWLENYDFAEKAEGKEFIVLALSGTDEIYPESIDDTARMNEGIFRVERMLKILEEDKGAKHAFASSYHFHNHFLKDTDYYENEKLIINKVSERAGKNIAIDVMSLTKEYYPYTARHDLYHPSRAGHHIYSQLWFEALLEFDGLEVPQWSRDEMMEEIEAEIARRQIITVSSPGENEAFAFGDEMMIQWNTDCDFIDKVVISYAHSSGTGYHGLDTVTCNDPLWQNYSWTIPTQILDDKGKSVDVETREVRGGRIKVTNFEKEDEYALSGKLHISATVNLFQPKQILKEKTASKAIFSHPWDGLGRFRSQNRELTQ